MASINRKSVQQSLQPFLDLDLLAWKGLPLLSVAAMDDAFGSPGAVEDDYLGWNPAQRRIYSFEAASGGLIAYARQGRIVMIETIHPPTLESLEGIEDPCVIKPHEIIVDGAYVGEHVYCKRGLVLSIAEPFEEGKPRWLVRCRGFEPINDPTEYGSDYHIAFEDRTVWGSN